MHTVKLVTSYRLQICNTRLYSAIGHTKTSDKQPGKPKEPSAAWPIKQKDESSDPSPLNPQGPTKKTLFVGRLIARTHPFDRVCRAGVHSCFSPRDHNRLHTGIY